MDHYEISERCARALLAWLDQQASGSGGAVNGNGEAGAADHLRGGPSGSEDNVSELPEPPASRESSDCHRIKGARAKLLFEGSISHRSHASSRACEQMQPPQSEPGTR